MSYKTILAVLRNESDCERVVQTIVPLALEHEAHLIGVHAEPYPVDYAMPLGVPDASYYEAARKQAQDKTDALKSSFGKLADAAGVPSEWRNIAIFDRSASVAALSSAFCADIVVAQQSDPSAEYSSQAGVETLLFDTGRPVLFVPYAGKPAGKVKKVLIAWNGRREAARAVFDAMPFITRADATEIFVVDPEETSQQDAAMAGTEIAATLARHGANVTVETQRSGGVPVGAIIENRLSDSGADLLVMGAYSHLRLREILFGGVTRTLLESMPTLTLMSR